MAVLEKEKKKKRGEVKKMARGSVKLCGNLATSGSGAVAVVPIDWK
jgi:hypothetical protein